MQYIGIMTGNSLDAVDVVLSDFSGDSIQDKAAGTIPYPQKLREQILHLRSMVKTAKSDMKELASDPDFINIINQYSAFVAEAVKHFLSENKIQPSTVRAIGFHGQTLDHFPPSVAGGKKAYTLQVGNAQLLADAVDIPVVYDFRSDDIFLGGEGAPLAPVHNLHLVDSLTNINKHTIAFCNAGNTGNIALINKLKQQIIGWDSGPFNHFPDMLAQRFWNKNCDENGTIGTRGKIIKEIVQQFYSYSAIDKSSRNFYEQCPPKSSDPQRYKLPDLSNAYKPEDILRSAEYFSAYTLALSLRFVPRDMPMPEHILLFGGGWQNPLPREDFRHILQDRFLPVALDSHTKIFSEIFSRFKTPPQIKSSDEYGISGHYMEARIFADAARCYVEKIPFCYPQITGCSKPCVCGVCCHPRDDDKRLWSRAAKGW